MINPAVDQFLGYNWDLMLAKLSALWKDEVSCSLILNFMNYLAKISWTYNFTIINLTH